MCIVKFLLKNFKSYKDQVEFSFEAQPSDFKPETFFVEKLNDGREVKILKSAVIYGPNASGKSNLIWAMRALRYYVVNSRDFAVNKPIITESFALDDDCLMSSTEMTMDFILSGEYYQYHIEYVVDGFINETLYEVCSNEKKIVYSCESGNITFGPAWKIENYDLNKNKILKNHLFLSELALQPSCNILDIYNMIANIVAEPHREHVNIKNCLDKVTTDYLIHDNSEFTKGLREIIAKADLGITSLKIIEHGEDEFKFPDFISESERSNIIEKNRWEYRFMHKGRNGVNREFLIQDESTGTQLAFTIGTLILKTLKEGGFIAYDEMGMALHPQLFKVFVQLFYSAKYNGNNAQLLFTSHDTSIIADDMMRADQLWFTSKNEFGESELYSAQDFEGMEIYVPFEEFYRRGRFGALPNITIH